MKTWVKFGLSITSILGLTISLCGCYVQTGESPAPVLLPSTVVVNRTVEKIHYGPPVAPVVNKIHYGPPAASTAPAPHKIPVPITPKPLPPTPVPAKPPIPSAVKPTISVKKKMNVDADQSGSNSKISY